MAGAPKGNKNALKHGLWAKKAHAVPLGLLSPGLAAAAGPGGSGRQDGRGSLEARSPEGGAAADIISPSERGLAIPGDGDVAAGPLKAIRYLEVVMDEIYARMKGADSEEFTRLANALSLAAAAFFNGHRTVAFLTGGMTPLEDAVRELKTLDYTED
jgi:hypothetical protein